MREAFSYMFKDPGYDKKLIPFCVISFISLLLIGAPEITNLSATIPTVIKVSNPFIHGLPFLGHIMNYLLYGYAIICIKAIIQQSTNVVLPFFNLKKSATKGLQIFLITIPYIIGLIVLTIAQAWVVLILSILIIIFFINAFLWNYANEENFLSAFAWIKTLKLIKSNKKTYFCNFGVMIIVNIVGVIISAILMNMLNFICSNNVLALLFTSIEGAIIACYTTFVGIYLIAKSINPQTVV